MLARWNEGNTWVTATREAGALCIYAVVFAPLARLTQQGDWWVAEGIRAKGGLVIVGKQSYRVSPLPPSPPALSFDRQHRVGIALTDQGMLFGAAFPRWITLTRTQAKELRAALNGAQKILVAVRVCNEGIVVAASGQSLTLPSTLPLATLLDNYLAMGGKPPPPRSTSGNN